MERQGTWKVGTPTIENATSPVTATPVARRAMARQRERRLADLAFGRVRANPQTRERTTSQYAGLGRARVQDNHVSYRRSNKS